MSDNVSPARIGMRLATIGLLLASGYLVWMRGGVLAWSGLFAAILLVAKHVGRPARTDVFLALGVALLWTAAWAATWAYVKTTWESGEVVALSVHLPGGAHTARVWILDVDGKAVMYYDAPPEAGRALLAGAPISVERGNTMRSGCANATAASELSGDEMASLLGVMNEKYQELNRATDAYYLLLGVERDRIGLVVRIAPCS